MRLQAILLCGILNLAPAWCFAVDVPAIDERAAAEFFEKKIRPLLAKHCYECHAHDKASESGQLAVDSRAALLKGGDRGPIVVPSKPDQSLLLKAVQYGDPKLQMPPEGKLSDTEIELLIKWITDGAFVPDYGVAAEKKAKEIDWTAAREFWSVRPLTRVTIPESRHRGKEGLDDAAVPSAIRDSQSAFRNPIDSFVVAKLHENDLAPSEMADRRTLIRRLSFDLIGLPPSPDDVADFVTDDRPDAYERLVDRLLASPHFGERWGRYWLDLARYVDDTPDWQKTTEQAWLYRDWVVRAINEDRPYDEFVKLQLAADLMPEAAPEDYAALGFIGLSPQYWKELKLAPSVIEVIVADEWDERLDAVSRTFLGLTVACARCHDHKFDPITTRDYYALAGVFASTDLSDRPLLPSPLAEQVREARHKLDSLRESLKKIKDKESEEARKIEQQIADLRTATPQVDMPMAPTIEEASVFVMPNGPDATKLDVRKRQPRDLPVFRRGNPSNPGDIVPRRFLELFSHREGDSGTIASEQPRRFLHGSGRGELADAIVRDAGALTARVIVNRVWSHHFSRGLVRTPSDFGQQGDRPSHPELLDWLAGELASGSVTSPASSGVRGPIDDANLTSQTGEERTTHSSKARGEGARRWSLKRLHRLLVTSATYRQQSLASSSIQTSGRNPQSLDPDNYLLWRMNRRRLEIEPWRDAMLFVSGELNDTMGGKATGLELPAHRWRTLYGKVGREEQHDMLRTFDFPPPTAHSPSRDVTTTPLQQLFVLNSQFVESRATEIASRLTDGSLDDRVTIVYQRLFQRPPSDNERKIGVAFLASATPERWRSYVKSLLGLNEFLFVD